MKVSAKRKSTGKSVEVEIDFPADLKLLVAKYGEPIVYNHAKGSMVVALQGWLRGQVDRETPEGDIRKNAKDWKPGQRRQGKTAQEKLRDLLGNMTPEQRAAALKDFKAGAAPANGGKTA